MQENCKCALGVRNIIRQLDIPIIIMYKTSVSVELDLHLYLAFLNTRERCFWSNFYHSWVMQYTSCILFWLGAKKKKSNSVYISFNGDYISHLLAMNFIFFKGNITGKERRSFWILITLWIWSMIHNLVVCLWTIVNIGKLESWR